MGSTGQFYDARVRFLRVGSSNFFTVLVVALGLGMLFRFITEDPTIVTKTINSLNGVTGANLVGKNLSLNGSRSLNFLLPWTERVACMLAMREALLLPSMGMEILLLVRSLPWASLMIPMTRWLPDLQAPFVMVLSVSLHAFVLLFSLQVMAMATALLLRLRRGGSIWHRLGVTLENLLWLAFVPACMTSRLTTLSLLRSWLALDKSIATSITQRWQVERLVASVVLRIVQPRRSERPLSSSS